MDWKAMPIKPSAGNWSASYVVEYCVAAPKVWLFAYGEKCKRFVAQKKRRSTHNQTENSNLVAILFAADTRTISIGKRERLVSILLGGARIWIVRRVP